MADEPGLLSFRYAGLSRLPDSIAQTRGVRRLDLTGNRLAELPEPIRGMLDLEFLRLDDNELFHTSKCFTCGATACLSFRRH